MENEEKEFIKKVNMDKAKNKTAISIGVLVVSISSYIFPLMFGEYDFGIIFEIASLIFIILARKYIAEYNETLSKRFIVLTMIPIGWLLIYDFWDLASYVRNGIDLFLLGYDYYFLELLSITNMLILFKIYRDLAKADNPEKFKESTDWFYEKYDKQ